MKHNRGAVMMGLGIVCFAAAITLIVNNNLEEQHGAEASAAVEKILKQEVLAEIPVEDDGQDVAETSMQTVEIEGHEYIGILELPSLGLTLPVMNEWAEDLLKISPCRYKGSFLENSMIIAGHNYKKHFSGIKQMQRGDPVYFTDVMGTRFSYEVESLETIEGTDLKGMEEGDWDLTLFTCNYGGQKRVAVRCRLLTL